MRMCVQVATPLGYVLTKHWDQNLIEKNSETSASREIARCILIDFPHSDQRRQKTREMASKPMKTKQFSLGSRCLVSMNFCLIFLICNSGHCLIRVIIKHNTMLR